MFSVWHQCFVGEYGDIGVSEAFRDCVKLLRLLGGMVTFIFKCVQYKFIIMIINIILESKDILLNTMHVLASCCIYIYNAVITKVGCITCLQTR